MSLYDVHVFLSLSQPYVCAGVCVSSRPIGSNTNETNELKGNVKCHGNFCALFHYMRGRVYAKLQSNSERRVFMAEETWFGFSKRVCAER